MGNDEEEMGEANHAVELSINSVVRLTTLGMMKLNGKLGQKEVVLIDSGASHNFISTKIVQQLDLTPSGTPGYGVIIGSGLTVKGKDVCKQIPLKLQSMLEVEDFLPLELGSSNVILGIQWLQKLGRMQVDWNTLTMTVDTTGTKVTLQGDQSLSKTPVSLKTMLKAFREQGEGFLLGNG